MPACEVAAIAAPDARETAFAGQRTILAREKHPMRHRVVHEGYGALRVERELGPRSSWTVVLAPRTEVGFLGTIVVRDRDQTLASRKAGTDAILTVWNAMCRIEREGRPHCS